MKRILQGLPFAVATLWLFTSVLVLATWRAPAGLPSPAPPSLSPAVVVPAPLAPLIAPPLAITVPTVVIAGRAPPSRTSARAATAEIPPHVWRCSGWRPLASGPEDQAVRYCE
jgi:hypothetical protein